jgi:hypothetical protein
MMNQKGFGMELRLRYSPGIPLEETKKNHDNVRIVGLRAEIWTRYLPNKKQEC